MVDVEELRRENKRKSDKGGRQRATSGERGKFGGWSSG